MLKRQNKGAVQVYTDGCYDWDRGVGGYGAVIFMHKGGENKIKKFASVLSYMDTTSNRMETRAILASLKQIEGGYNIDVYTDSTYCEGIAKKITNKLNYLPKENQDLWKLVGDEIKKHRQKGSWVNVSWIRGHSGNPFNEMADKLADRGSKRAKKVICDPDYHEKKAARKNKKKKPWKNY